MLSLLEHLDRLSNYEEKPTDPEQPKLPFEPGAPLLSIDNYLVQVNTTDHTDNDSCRPAFDVNSGEVLNFRVYDQRTFNIKAQLIFSGVEGVCEVRDVKATGDSVFVFGTRTFGDLHQYLRGKKKLSEAKAAPLFKQIVQLVANAHKHNIALRDIKLKKFVFTDENW